MTLNLAHFPQVDHGNLLYISFNQTFECFAVGLTNGFRIFNCLPFGESGRKEFHGGIGIVEMLFRSNILALVGDGRDTHFPTSQVVLWDDRRSQSLAEVAFRQPVRAVRLHRHKLIVALEDEVYLYNLDDLQSPTKFPTFRNFHGILSVSANASMPFLVCPSDTRGHLRVQSVESQLHHTIPANDSGIACAGLSPDGRLVGVASEKGTIIRVFLVETGVKVRELRRGTTSAEIHSIAFSADGAYMLTTSDRGTLHVWYIGGGQPAGADAPTDDAAFAAGGGGTSGPNGAAGGGAASAKNTKSMWSLLSPVSGYFASEWSGAQWSGPEVPTVAGFDPNGDGVHVVCADGTFYHLGIELKVSRWCVYVCMCMYVLSVIHHRACLW